MSLDYDGIEGLVYLGNGSEKYQQLVYASSLYGTFFAVYGNFQVEDNGSDGLKIARATFRLVNYKGILDIGLRKVKFNKERQECELKIQALKQNKECTLENFVIDPTEKLRFIRNLSKVSSKEKYIHDDEFYYRDGDFKMNKPPYDLLNNDNCGDIEKCIQSKVPYELDAIDKAPGGRCMLSELKVLI
ncbi:MULTISPECIES: hypothetical protein [Flavobacteriaceae]|uniref:hypothetical protein n=1 Tax=Flavobacteriaceae TaxID=49546 RepID=UPI0026EBF0DB|nr:hypothetical protein [Mesonia mobilis]